MLALPHYRWVSVGQVGRVTVGQSGRDRVLDLLAVVTVVPTLVTMGQATRSAWRVYHPKRRPIRHTPQSIGLEAERVTVAGADGNSLACWFIPRQGATDVVVLGHGMSRNSGMVMPLARVLHNAGYHVFTFDMRNHGESADDGLWRGQSPRYAIDFHHVVRYLMERPDLAGAKVGCVGFSMSAWTALEAARLEPGTVRAVVCDSGPTVDIAATIRRMYDAGRSRLPGWMQGPLMFRIGLEAFTFVSIFLLKPAPWPRELGDHSIELLFIVGDRDPVVRPDDIREQVMWYPHATVWAVPGGRHTTSHLVAPEEYASRVLSLMEKAFRTPTDGAVPTRADDSGAPQ